MRNAFIRTLADLARRDDRIFLVTPDMGFSVLEGFRDEFPDRFLNVGVAEQNAIGVAAGLALSGYAVYVYSIVPFVTMRCFEQVRVDVAYQKTNVTLVGVGAGLSYGPAGATHHSIEDIAVMRALPGMTVLCPGDPIEVEGLLRSAHARGGPTYLRLGKNGEPRIHRAGTPIGVGDVVEVVPGSDLILITTSNMLEQGLRWVQEWAQEGVSARLVSMPTLKPLNEGAVLGLLRECLPVVTLEEHNIIGGLASAVADVIARSGHAVRFHPVAIADCYSHHVGSQRRQQEHLGLAARPSLRALGKP